MPETPTCPRCGYDLSGHTASWETSCPLEGQCSECGLEFAWNVVMRRDLQAPRWSFEHAPGSLPQLAAALFGTTAHMLLPRTLRELSLWHPVSPGRLRTLALLWLIGSGVAFYGVSLALATLEAAIGGGRWRPSPPLFDAISSTAFNPFWPYEHYAFWKPLDYIPAIFPLAIVVCIVMPLTFFILRTTLRTASVRRIHLLRLGVMGLIYPIALWIFWIVMHAIGGWGFAFPNRILKSSLAEILIERQWILGILWLAWFALYWQWAISGYLRLPHARGVLAAMLLLSTLAGALAQAAMYFLTGDPMFIYLDHFW